MMSSRTSVATISAYVAATLTAGPAFAAGSNSLASWVGALEALGTLYVFTRASAALGFQI
jgi:hypothetical protein